MKEYLTVQDLIELLQKHDPNRFIILQRDPEGNGYAPIGECYTSSWDKNQNEAGLEELTPELIAAGYGEGDLVAGKPALVLAPRW